MGNVNGKLKVLGASNHTDAERSKMDYYGTDPRSTRALLEVEKFDHKVWEPCAGHHLIVDVLKDAGYEVRASDVADYGFGDEILDIMQCEEAWDGDIVTNPPYFMVDDIVEKCLEMLRPGHKLAMFLPNRFMEGVKRYERIMKDKRPKYQYMFCNRQTSSKEDDFTVGSAVFYCWYVWEKGWKEDYTITKHIMSTGAGEKFDQSRYASEEPAQEEQPQASLF